MSVHVLAATDFSAPAAVAIEWAALIARAQAGTLHLVHGVPPLYPPMDQTAMWADLALKLCLGAREKLEEMAEPWRASGLPTECHAESGRPARVIAEVAERVGARLIVVGTRGHSRLAHLLLGSTAGRVIERVPCPVLAVHPEDRLPAAPPELILLPTDFSADARLAADRALQLLRLDRSRARLLLLHAWQLPGDYALLDYAGPSFLTAFREETVAAASRVMEEKASGLRGQGVEVETVLREGSAAGSIVDLAAERGVGLIAMGTHGASGLERLVMGSTALQVIQHAPCPVLTIRLPQATT
jgi:nucleotide-binding universal stress UspA family protein